LIISGALISLRPYSYFSSSRNCAIHKMAASGIQEHNEARRKEMRYLRAAKRDKEMKAAIASGQVQMMYPEHNSNNSNQHGTSYERELQSRSQCRVVGSPPGIRGGGTDAVSVDRQRRMEHYNQQQQEYSAKIPGRFRNFDYTSQW